VNTLPPELAIARLDLLTQVKSSILRVKPKIAPQDVDRGEARAAN
jgi:hypothetical protein